MRSQVINNFKSLILLHIDFYIHKMQKFQIGYIRFKYFSTAKANPLLNHEAESLSIRYGTTKTLNINFRTFGCGSFLQSTDILSNIFLGT